MRYIVRPKKADEKEFYVGSRYRTNPLSHIPTSEEVQVGNQIYDNIHYPRAYCNRVNGIDCDLGVKLHVQYLNQQGEIILDVGADVKNGIFAPSGGGDAQKAQRHIKDFVLAVGTAIVSNDPEVIALMDEYRNVPIVPELVDIADNYNPENSNRPVGYHSYGFKLLSGIETKFGNNARIVLKPSTKAPEVAIEDVEAAVAAIL